MGRSRVAAALRIEDARNDLESVERDWLPPRDSNPDMLIQSQLSYH